MRLIHSLKEERSRTALISNQDADLNCASAFDHCLVLICLVKQQRIRQAEKLLEEFERHDLFFNLSKEEKLEIFELAAVLWAQRDFAGSRLSVEQAKLLKIIFINLGGTSVFSDESSVDLDLSQSTLKTYRKSSNVSQKFQIYIVFRELWHNNDQAARPHEIGIRLRNAFSIGGWEAKLLTLAKVESKLSGISSNSIVLLDIDALGVNRCNKLIDSMPKNIKFIGLASDFHFNSKEEDVSDFNELMSKLCVLWTASESINQRAILANFDNWTDFPLPNGQDSDVIDQLVRIRKESPWEATLVGSIERVCLPRIIYLVDSVITGNYTFSLSSHLNDGLDSQVSHQHYLQRLVKSQISLNFGLRFSGVSIRTGRIIEVISTAGLLVHDQCPALQSWFEEDVHYAAFINEYDINEKLEDILIHVNRYKSIRDEALDYYVCNYSERELVKHFAHFF
jgi:hypothetical protein